MANGWPFVGRANELARLGSLLESGTGALILGDAGVGKTALARQVERKFSAAGFPVGRVTGHAVSNGTPYEAFAGMLTLADISLLSPVEVARRTAAALPREPGTRILFVVDDVQLLDERSAQVLLQLAAEGTAAVLATARDLRLPAAIERLWHDGLCERVHLTGLTEDEVVELIETVLEAPIDSAAAHAFATRSQGNPLLLRELVHAALGSSALARRGTAWTLTGQPPISAGIRDLVRSRLDALPVRLRSALETVAAGEPLPLDVAAELLGDSVLEDLDAGRLITVRTGLAGPEVSGTHPLDGEVLRDSIPPLRMRRLRLSLAGALEAAPRPSPHDLVRAALWRLESGQADDPERLLAGSRAARVLSLETAERLARHVHETSGSLQATLLLAEILTNVGRSAEAVELTQALPPDSLSAADREALVYCTAIEGLHVGDPGGAADIVGGVLAGVPAASDQLRGLYASLLAFDTRLDEALDVAGPLVDDAGVDPLARTFAAVGAIGAVYWLGRTQQTVTMADAIAPLAESVRAAVPWGPSSLELLAICALVDEGEFGQAAERARRMRARAAADRDPFAGPRGDYCLGRVELARGLPATAMRRFRRCLAGIMAFDRTSVPHVSAMLARAAAAVGDLKSAHAAFDGCADMRGMRAYEPEFELSVAALLAAELRMDEAAERAAWAAGTAFDRAQWNDAVAGYHDAVRYGAARAMVVPMREAAAHVDGEYPRTLLHHAVALAAQDAAGLDDAAKRFEAHGAILVAAEASAQAAMAHTAAGRPRLAGASAAQSVSLRARCEGATSPWLAGVAGAVPLTARERQTAVLATLGHSDAAIAGRLGISHRTVQTHLARVYVKLGITSRGEIADHLNV
jgi:DNA-binding NarL/FixJ family response regulator